MIATTPISVLARAERWLGQGRKVVLITLVGVEGRTSRGIGTMMAVNDKGDSYGSQSGGCLDAALIAEARIVIEDGHGHLIRFGAGSPYIDLQLPCGGGIDLLFTFLANQAVIEAILIALDCRQPALIELTETGICHLPGDAASHKPFGWQQGAFTWLLHPCLRLLIYGQGEELHALARLGKQFGAHILAFSPLERDANILWPEQIAVGQIAHLGDVPRLTGDAWSAVIFLFHEREWEQALLPSALELNAFYHGAVGSKRTHSIRMTELAQCGVPAERVARLQGHIGLIPSTRDPATLALSILAQVVESFNRSARLIEGRENE